MAESRRVDRSVQTDARSRPARPEDGAAESAPQRTCAGCGRKASQAELIRFSARQGTLVPAATGGRGVYTCRRLACFERAASRRAFNRTLKKTVRVDPALARLYTDADG